MTAGQVHKLARKETLRQRLERGPLPADKATDLALRIAQVLAAQHESGRIVGRLDAEHVLLDRQGSPRLVDVGEPAQPPSPEQAEGEVPDERSDVFAFGALFYEMLTGERYDVQSEEGPSLDPRVVARPIRDVVGGCLEARPEARFADGPQVVRVLGKAIRRSATRPPAPAPPRTKYRVAGLVIGMTGFAMFIIGVLWRGERAASYGPDPKPSASAPPTASAPPSVTASAEPGASASAGPTASVTAAPTAEAAGAAPSRK